MPLRQPPRPTTRPTSCARRRSSSSPTPWPPAQPFFLHLSFKAPHGPFEPAPRHVGKFAGLPHWRPASYNEPDVSDKPTWVQNTPQLTPAEQADLDDIRIAQLEMLQAVDEAIGGSTTYGITGIMQHLRNLGIADNTIVVYFADNGWHWGEHRSQAKNKPYEESIRSPMFVRYPKLAPLPRVESRIALNIDLCPTFVELARARRRDPPPTIAFDGTSLVRLSTARRRPGAPTSSPRDGRPTTSGRRCAKPTGSTPSCRSRPAIR